MSVNRSRHAVSAALTLAMALCLDEVGPRAGAAAAEVAQDQAAAAVSGARDALQRYSAALESLDVNAVKKVQPSIPTDSLAKAFKEMRQLEVDIDEIRVLSADGTMARVSCRVTQTLTPRAGSRKTTAVTRVMRLRREADIWLIDGFER